MKYFVNKNIPKKKNALKSRRKANNYYKNTRKTQKHLDKRKKIEYNIVREFCKRPLARVYTEMYSRGRRGAPAKGVGRVTGARVQISPSPPTKRGITKGDTSFCS